MTRVELDEPMVAVQISDGRVSLLHLAPSLFHPHPDDPADALVNVVLPVINEALGRHRDELAALAVSKAPEPGEAQRLAEEFLAETLSRIEVRDTPRTDDELPVIGESGLVGVTLAHGLCSRIVLDPYLIRPDGREDTERDLREALNVALAAEEAQFEHLLATEPIDLAEPPDWEAVAAAIAQHKRTEYR